MKILALGRMPQTAFVGIPGLAFVETPEEADVVVLAEGLKSYFLGTHLGELIEKAHSLEFTKGKPVVRSFNDFISSLTLSDQARL